MTTQNLLFVSPQEILMGRETAYPLSAEMKENLDKLLVSVNKLRWHWGKPIIITSGYRPPEINAKVGGSPNSAHMFCQAVDIRDRGGELAKFLIERLDVLEDCQLYMEDPQFTVTKEGLRWVHVSTRRPLSGARIFKPENRKPNSPPLKLVV